ncbi:MAG: ArsR family transcriptional regulator [Gammaproteobacteria bacterium]|nr:ArsR family transcriptional regulator [Gammaproteobacteria bacterium]
MSNDKSKQHPHRFAYDGLDRVIHERARLGVLTSLVSHPKGLPFGDLKQLCDLTDGNLSRHLQVLQAAQLVEISKGFEHNRTQTICRITGPGRKTLPRLSRRAGTSRARRGSGGQKCCGRRRHARTGTRLTNAGA